MGNRVIEAGGSGTFPRAGSESLLKPFGESMSRLLTHRLTPLPRAGLHRGAPGSSLPTAVS